MAFEDIQDPLVKDYLERQLRAKQGESEAAERKRNLDVAAGVGDILGGLANQSTPNQVYFNRWENMGAAPKSTSTTAIKPDLNPLRQAGERAVSDAKEGSQKATQDFMTEQKITDMSRGRQAEDAKAASEKEKSDPNSAVSVAARQMLKMVAPNTPDEQIANLSAAQLEKISPDIVKASEARLNREFQAYQSQASRDFQAGENAKNRAASRENAVLAADDRRAAREAQAAKGKEPTATQQDVAAKASMALEGVKGMAAALAQGQNTFSLVGDNDFTRYRRQFEEGLGRLQSGGAINADEEIRFRAMAPTVTDSARIQAAKLQQIQKILQDRINSTGVNVQASKPSAQPAPHGQTVIQDGVTYVWNGSEYVER